ncbi:Hypothetical protein (Fragment) [Durusdinium trenchii]|uniref:Uncharacterized protein n=1 Tax=Durusdinium trenchii TaxID=1381693 RepID=A0ABP0K7L9_9DINO
MELEVLSVQGAGPDQVVSIRAGSQRKQAAVSSLGQGTPFRLTGSHGVNPFRIDILQQVGSARLALRPGEGTYSIDVKGAGTDGGNVNVAFAVREMGRSNQPKPHPASEEEDRRFFSQAAAAKEYLESHELLPFVRALLQTVIRDRPKDPYSFISDQFRLASVAGRPRGGESNDTTAFTEPLLKKAIPEVNPQPKEVAPVVPTVEHKAVFAQRDPPAEERDVESLRLQVRDALGQAVEDGQLEELMKEAESQPFAAVRAPAGPRLEPKLLDILEWSPSLVRFA